MNNFSNLTEQLYEVPREYGKADKLRLAIIARLVGFDNKVLDIGCYNGILSKILIGQNNKVYGVDIAKESLKQAKILGVQTKRADLEKKIPFNSNSFDVAVAAEIIEHIADTDKFLSEVYRIIRPGGFLVLSTSNLVSLGRRFSYLIGSSGYHEASYSLPKGAAGHLRYFNKEMLLELLESHHFTIEIFTSDIVNFSYNTKSVLQSKISAQLFPTLGRSLIVKARKR